MAREHLLVVGRGGGGGGWNIHKENVMFLLLFNSTWTFELKEKNLLPSLPVKEEKNVKKKNVIEHRQGHRTTMERGIIVLLSMK